MSSARTLMGVKFQYSGSLETELIVHRNVDIHISADVIQMIRGEIEKRSPVLMGACRDNPTRNSIGEALLNNGYSPQMSSYVIPLLIEEGFCKASDRRPYKIIRTDEVVPNKGVQRIASKHGSPLVAQTTRTRNPIDPCEVQAGSDAFRKREKRSAIYNVSTFLINQYWGDPSKMAEALGVLLLVWNNALYRYGLFDYDALGNVLRENKDDLDKFRKRNIESFGKEDKEPIIALFAAFLDGLAIAEGRSKGSRSPVGVAKALHLLAPEFFPLWDNKIAKEYGCHCSHDSSRHYLRFMEISKGMAESLRGKVETRGSTLLKVIDEYNYAKFTKQWI